MTRQLLRRSAPAFLGVAMLACAGDSALGPERIDRLPRDLTIAEQQVVAAGNDFAFALFRELARLEPGENVVASPLSASFALGMTLNGARGATFDAMRETLRVSGLELAEINASYRGLIDLLLELDPEVVFDIANSVWHARELPVEELFLQTVRSTFDAEVAALDFGNAASVDVINGWVERSTNGRIDEIVEELEPSDVMFLINAIYFKGTWTRQFDPALTRAQPFHVAPGTTKSVPLMQLEERLLYQGGLDFQAVDLPYGGDAFRMTVILPNEGVDLESFVADLEAPRWAELVQGFHEQKLVLYLPRFRLEWEATLNDALTSLGMGIAFDDGLADFTAISRGGGLFIDQVKQKTFLEVNEEGTEAAAVTSVGVDVVSAPPEVRVDRPFLLAIRERFSGAVLFLGKVVDPS